MSKLTESDKKRFFAKVGREGECWPWKGAKRGEMGYGIFTLSGSAFLAHRVMFAIEHPEFEPELLTKRPGYRGNYILHSCDNPPCVNPAHLRLGDATDNARDRVERGRDSKVRTMERWERTGLTPEIVDALRFALAIGDEDGFWFLKYKHRITDMVSNKIKAGRSFRWHNTKGIEFRDGKYVRV